MSEVYCVLSVFHQEDMVAVTPSPGDVNFENWLRLLSARFLHYEVTICYLCNILQGDTLKLYTLFYTQLSLILSPANSCLRYYDYEDNQGVML